MANLCLTAATIICFIEFVISILSVASYPFHYNYLLYTFQLSHNDANTCPVSCPHLKCLVPKLYNFSNPQHSKPLTAHSSIDGRTRFP